MYCAIVLRRHPVDDDVARRIDEAEITVVQLQIAAAVDQPGIHRRYIAEMLDLVAEFIDDAFEELQCPERDRLRLGQRRQDTVPAVDFERSVDAAWNGPGRVDAFPGQSLDHLLAEPTQCDAILGQLRIVLDDADDIASGRIGIEAEQQVGRREMEEAQRMGLDDLAAMHDLAQLRRGRRNAHAHDGFARLGRSDAGG